jgi:hypothetical protein
MSQAKLPVGKTLEGRCLFLNWQRRPREDEVPRGYRLTGRERTLRREKPRRVVVFHKV